MTENQEKQQPTTVNPLGICIIEFYICLIVSGKQKIKLRTSAEVFLNFFQTLNGNSGTEKFNNSNYNSGGFPGSTVVKNPPASAGDTGSSPGPGRSHMPRSN